ncbi:MAG: hypothetical protein QM655_06240 [Nocardioidaceae bacterium]
MDAQAATLDAGLDTPSELAAALVQVRHDEMAAAARKLALAALWADTHDPCTIPSDVAASGQRRAVEIGAAGTPSIDEYGADELGCLLQVSPYRARRLIADALNLRHRHPLLWQRVQAVEVEAWVAEKTARLAAGLSLDRARWLDEQTAEHAVELAPGRYLRLVEATVVKANPEKARRDAEEQATERFVHVGQADEHGNKTVFARGKAPQIVHLDAMIARIAQILAERGVRGSNDVLRSEALAILASPARAIQLLAEAAVRHQPDSEPTESPTDETADETADEQADEEAAAAVDPEMLTALAAALADLDPAKLRPNVDLHVHIAPGSALARCEELGPILISQLGSLFAGCHITVKPILDLAGQAPVDAYEIPIRIRETMAQRHPYEVFPYGSARGRSCELDHTIPYVSPDRGGPPGQTSVANLGPLSKHHHRLKTHAPGWIHKQPLPGVHCWRTPTGYWYTTDPWQGTRDHGLTPPDILDVKPVRLRRFPFDIEIDPALLKAA